jgi:large subunit ribosomal protein L7/L12
MPEKMTVDQFVEAFGQFTVIELAELKGKLKTKYNIEAAAAVAAVAALPTGGAAEVEEQTEFDVILKDSGSQKIKVIKAIREVTSLGLKEAKALADEAPKPIKTGVSKEEAAQIKAKIEEVGGVVELK